jgi:hypothetical protein
MRIATIIMLVLALAPLAGCATGGGINLLGEDRIDPFADLRTFVREDVSHALALATQATDEGAPFRARCYSTLLAFLPEPAPVVAGPTIKGLVSGYEVAAELRYKVDERGQLIPEQIQADCGYIRAEILKFMLRSGAKIAPVPGVGALGGVLR